MQWAMQAQVRVQKKYAMGESAILIEKEKIKMRRGKKYLLSAPGMVKY